MDAFTNKPGSLTIVGTGIESIGQITLQALAYIEAADKVFYCVLDPATEAFLINKNKNSTDLYKYYDNGKHRVTTYIQMAEVMLREVRLGLNVVGVFYGHPGVFVNPSHRALAIAREEGYEARILPGISAEDCLYADLCIDPASPGCLTYEVGCIAVTDFNFVRFNNNKFDVLLDRLESEYGPDHSVVHYIAAMLPYQDPVMDKFTISQLRDPKIARQVGGVSTFYIPPKSRKQDNLKFVYELGLVPPDGVEQKSSELYPISKWEASPMIPPYDSTANAAIAQLDTHVVSEDYQPLATSKAMTDVMTQLALDPKALAKFKANQSEFVRSVPGLSALESAALEMGQFAALRRAMKFTPPSMMERLTETEESGPLLIIANMVVIGSIMAAGDFK